MPTRDEFVARHSPRWQELNQLLGDRQLYRLPPERISRVAALYRAIGADLMRARALGCGRDVTDHLDILASRAHNALYGPRPYSLAAVTRFVVSDFPRAVRRNARFVLSAAVLFMAPLAVGVVGALGSEEFALKLLPPATLEQMADAYLEGFSGRDLGTDATMAGFYVHNNVGIAFRCFATGILFGLGSIFYLIYNGLMIGTVVGFVSRSGAAENLLTFTSGHSSFELTAIVISGAAGLKMGYSLVATGGRTRLDSLRGAAKELAELVLGAALMLLIAALIEGFWSPSSVPKQMKWAFAGLGALSVLAYLTFMGRHGEASVQAAEHPSRRAPSSGEVR